MNDVEPAQEQVATEAQWLERDRLVYHEPPEWPGAAPRTESIRGMVLRLIRARDSERRRADIADESGIEAQRERDEARATKDMYKERMVQAQIAQEKAEAELADARDANSIAIGALKAEVVSLRERQVSEPTSGDEKAAREFWADAPVRGDGDKALMLGHEARVAATARFRAQAREEKHKTCCGDCTHCEDTALEVQALYADEYKRGFDEGRLVGRAEASQIAQEKAEALNALVEQRLDAEAELAARLRDDVILLEQRLKDANELLRGVRIKYNEVRYLTIGLLGLAQATGEGVGKAGTRYRLNPNDLQRVRGFVQKNDPTEWYDEIQAHLDASKSLEP